MSCCCLSFSPSLSVIGNASHVCLWCGRHVKVWRVGPLVHCAAGGRPAWLLPGKNSNTSVQECWWWSSLRVPIKENTLSEGEWEEANSHSSSKAKLAAKPKNDQENDDKTERLAGWLGCLLGTSKTHSLKRIALVIIITPSSTFKLWLLLLWLFNNYNLWRWHAQCSLGSGWMSNDH